MQGSEPLPSTTNTVPGGAEPAATGVTPTETAPEPARETTRTESAPAAEATSTKARQLVLKQEPGQEIENEEPEDLKKQKQEKDFSGEYGKRTYCKRHYQSLLPIKFIFILSGRFPFSTSLLPEGTYLYKYSIYSPWSIYFTVSTICMIGTLFCGLWNVAHVALNISISHEENTQAYQEQREHEVVLIQRYYIPLIFVYSSLIHGCISSLLILNNRHYIANYLTFWSKAVYTMHMDVARKARNFSFLALTVFIVVVVFLTLLSVFRIGPTAIGLPTVFGDLTFRQFITTEKWLLANSTETYNIRSRVQVAGGLFLIFTFTASKSAILLFVYHCKTLQSTFAYWNGRVYAAVLRGEDFAQTTEGRTTFKLLFKDHCVLMDLMEGMDQVFAFTVESYFGCQVFSLFFELYFFIRTAKHGDNQIIAAYPEKNQDAYFVRPKDWAPGLLMLLLSVLLMFTAAKSAAHVAEEAKAGLEVLRRKTMLERKTDEELFFMLSMFSSYTAYKKMEINCGGYYYMNKDFLIGLMSAVLSYFIILYQFQPVMDISYPGNTEARPDRIKYGKFLTEIEGLPDEHYETTTSQDDIWGPFRP